MKKVCVVFGTRPEAIKLCPLIKELESRSDARVISCALRQHGKMLDQVLSTFSIRPTYMIPVSFGDKALFGKGISVPKRVWSLIKTQVGLGRFVMMLRREKPDYIVVQGDTSTAFLGAFLAFHFKISIVHVEAGLRTGDKYHPFPEEMNRKLIGALADIHCAPTTQTRDNLLREGIDPNSVFVTGNTVIDALKWVLQRYEREAEYYEQMRRQVMNDYNIPLDKSKRLILLTAHRRENFGGNIETILYGAKRIAENHDDVQIVYPVHANPNVAEPAREILGNIPGIHLTDSIAYESFIFLMRESYCILTDSGGIQEEASQIGVPVLVLRTVTERQEAVKQGNVRLIPITEDSIYDCTRELLEDEEKYKQMAQLHDAYGDGTTSKQIADILLRTEQAETMAG